METALKNLEISLSLAKHKPLTFPLFPLEALSTINLHQQNNK